MIADPKLPGKVLAAVEGIQFDEFGETLIKTAESVRDVIPDLIDNEVLSSLQGAAKGLEGLSIPTSLADMPDIAKELSGEINLTKQILSIQEQDIYYIPIKPEVKSPVGLDYDIDMLDKVSNPDLLNLNYEK